MFGFNIFKNIKIYYFKLRFFLTKVKIIQTKCKDDLTHFKLLCSLDYFGEIINTSISESQQNKLSNIGGFDVNIHYQLILGNDLWSIVSLITDNQELLDTTTGLH